MAKINKSWQEYENPNDVVEISVRIEDLNTVWTMVLGWLDDQARGVPFHNIFNRKTGEHVNATDRAENFYRVISNEPEAILWHSTRHHAKHKKCGWNNHCGLACYYYEPPPKKRGRPRKDRESDKVG